LKNVLILFLILLFYSCAKSPIEESSDAIDIALTHLSHEECDDALEVLQDLGNQPSNAIYLQVLASAYACKASFNELSFIATDLTVLDATSTETIMTSLVKFSLSSETEADSDNYSNILSGINVLLGSTAGSPSHTGRVTKFGSRKAGDMSVQALILNLVNLGKFLNYYGNVNAAGAKGQGTNTNSCFLNYSDPRATAQISGGVGGVCNSNNDGHPDLDKTTTAGKRRMCEGLVLLTNVIDIIDNLNLSTSTELTVLEDLSTQVNTFLSAATAAGLGSLVTMTSQSTCETAMSTASNLNDLEFFYSIIFEKGLQ
jgi:hypothetical protein